VNDSAIWMIGEVFLLWCLGVILVVWVLVMWRRRRGWDDLDFLMVWICVVEWVLDVAVVVWLWVVVMICVRDNSLVVGWLCSGHPVPGGLFSDNPLLGVRNPRHETGSNICAVVAPVLGPGLACHCRGPGGYS
jgi:hypothetical protein